MPRSSTQLPGVTELLATAVGAVGGSERPGQVAMAEAVTKAIRTGDHLAVQAGTGTGKSLAYLVPALRHAVEREATVVVSTATIALQRQLIDRDLPRLEKALEKELGRKPTFAILKGRRNYLCLNKLDSGMQDEPDDATLFDPFAISAIGREVTRLREWVSDTETGDRDELVPGVTEHAWRQVSVSARECLGASRCPVGTDCFAEKGRAEAGRADLIVTNHALLAIDALQGFQVLPEHDLVIVDEAHDLVDRVTSAATAELTSGAVAAAARRAGRVCDQELADRLLEAGDGFALMLEDLPAARLDVLPAPLAGALAVVRDAAYACLSGLGPDQRTSDVEVATARKLAQSQLDEVHDTAVRLLRAFETDDAHRRDVVWRTGDTGSGATAPARAQGRAARGVRAAARAAVRRAHHGPHLGHAHARRHLRHHGPLVGPAGRAGRERQGRGRRHRQVPRGSEVDRAGRRLAVRPRQAAASSTWPSTCPRPAATACNRPMWTSWPS